MTKFPDQHRKVPRLIDQGKVNGCFAAAICMCIEAEYKRLYDEELHLDWMKFYKETTAGGRPPHLTKALKHAHEKGVFDTLSKTYIKITNYRFVQRVLTPFVPNIVGEIKAGRFVIVSLDIGNTKTFKELTVNGVLQPRYKEMHAVVGVDTVGLTGVVFANTWGDDYGVDGYALIDLNHGVDRKSIEKGYVVEV